MFAAIVASTLIGGPAFADNGIGNANLGPYDKPTAQTSDAGALDNANIGPYDKTAPAATGGTVLPALITTPNNNGNSAIGNANLGPYDHAPASGGDPGALDNANLGPYNK
jgi:hypothetical protein